jgi:hypothetical protein
MPAQAGIQSHKKELGPRFRGDERTMEHFGEGASGYPRSARTNRCAGAT